MIPTRRNIAIRYAGPVSVGPAGIVDALPPARHASKNAAGNCSGEIIAIVLIAGLDL
jgi:hypothetical protein